ncbi:MAG: ATP-dependent helicase [Clostridia bacterium]|nr:ATP-dependent helicase [Clostridia bacterium]
MTYSEFKTKYNLTLNEAQDNAVMSISGATLLLAVPGSGKTTVLVSRLGYMINALGIPAESILTMTYTVAATKDMKQRFISLFGDESAQNLEFRTINGVCAKIIMSYERISGGKAFELITDEKQLSAVISAIYRDVSGEFPTEADIKNLRTMITYAKNMMLGKTKIAELDTKELEFSTVFTAYNEYLRKNRLMDYDDQMLYAYAVLTKHPEITKEYREKYRYILVDEAQDTSKIQHSIIRLLAGKDARLFMVGDEDQSIYGFRAAYPKALLSFNEDYNNSKILLMEENYRSDANIVSMASRFISANRQRHEKNMKAVQKAQKSVRRVNLITRENQYGYLLKVAVNSVKQTAILYRDNESALPFIDIFERQGIKYNSKAFDSAFFTHRVVRDIVDIINFSLNMYDTQLFLKIYYKLSTYLTKETAQTACKISEEKGIDVFSAVFQLPGLNTGTKKACTSVYSNLKNISSDKAGNIIHRISGYMGYSDYLSRVGVKTSKLFILENIASRVKNAREFLNRLDELAVLTKERKYDNDANIILSTIHSSKGLEYTNVYIIDVVDGFFPEITVSDYKNATKEEIRLYEEERRLFYVGVTRAKSELTLFSYRNEPSCFLNQFFGEDKKKEQEENKAITEDNASFSEYKKKFKKRAIICHKHFGIGEIIDASGDIVEVKFNIGINKKLSVKVLYDNELCSVE